MTENKRTKCLSEKYPTEQHVFYIKKKLKAVVKAVNEKENKIYISFHPRGGKHQRVNKWVDAKQITKWKSPKERKHSTPKIKNVNTKENRYYNQVRQFHISFGHPAPNEPTRLTAERKEARIKWMQEELDEYKEATTLYDEVDGLIDLIYFAIGTLVEKGVKPDRIFDIVQNANMSKLWEDGKPRFRDGDNKIIKPDGWVAPEPLIKEEIDRQIKAAQVN